MNGRKNIKSTIYAAVHEYYTWPSLVNLMPIPPPLLPEGEKQTVLKNILIDYKPKPTTADQCTTII